MKNSEDQGSELSVIEVSVGRRLTVCCCVIAIIVKLPFVETSLLQVTNSHQQSVFYNTKSFQVK